MTVRALYPYEFPSKDRPENFGDDMLVNVEWVHNLLFTAPVCVRVPQAMTWAAFKAEVIDPWAGADPGYDPSAATDWQLDGGRMSPSDGTTLTEAGVAHKSLITFRA